ncbi:MAG: terminase gpA endonuclease subunit [Pirellulaceae bacterium]
MGSWSLWKGKNLTFHQMFVDHTDAEYPERVYVEKTDRTVDEWRKRPGRPDNHVGDCLVMCLVAQAMLGRLA